MAKTALPMSVCTTPFCLRLILLLGCAIPVAASAQEIFLSTLDNRLYQLDLEDCTYQQVGNVPSGSTDICFHPNTYLYSVSGNGRLFQVDIATGAGTLIHTFENSASQLYTSLTADANGVFYTCGLNGRLFSYNLATNTGTYLGNVGYAAEGDLTFYNGQLYMAASGDDIVRVDIANPPNSNIAVNGNVPGRIFGIVSYAEACDSISSYAFTDNAAQIYRVDYANQALISYCSIPLSVSGGASAYEYLGSNPIDVDITITDFVCNAPAGIIEVEATGGIGTLTYSLDGQNFQLENEFTDLAVDSYTVFVQDEVGCLVTEVIDLGPGFPNIDDIAVTPPSCGENNGSIAVSMANGMPPFSLSVNNGPPQNSLTLQNLAAGSYKLTIRDAGGCVLTETVVLSAGDAPEISNIAIVSTSCGNNNGQIAVTATGGVLPLTYALSNGIPQASGVFPDLLPGSYILHVIDAAGCIVNSGELVIAPSETLFIDEIIVTDATCTKSNGALTIVASGGKLPLIYAVDGIDFGPENTFIGLQARTYHPAVRDADGCRVDAVQTLTGTIPPHFIYNHVKAAECQEANGSLEVIFEDGEGPVTLTLNGRVQVEPFLIENLPAGDYELILQDSIGCTDTLNLVIPRTRCPIYLPNAFSPNDDGINDRFRPEAIGDLDAQVVRFYIFDRWGGFVFKSENHAFYDPANAWNGERNGKPMGQGVYTWLLEVVYSDGGREMKTGEVVLVK